MSVLSDYLLFAKVSGKSDATLRQYKWHLERMLVTLAPTPSEREILEWYASLRDKWEPATIKMAIGAARDFYRYCFTHGLSPSSYEDILKTPVVPEREQRTITVSEFNKMVRKCDPTKLVGVRNRALITLMFDTGMRATEVCRCGVNQLHLDDRYLIVRVKGGNDRKVWFGVTCKHRLQKWVEVRPKTQAKTLFTSLGGNTPGEPLTTRGLRIVVKRIGERAGIEDVSPHAFRRGFTIAGITEAGWSTREVQEAGGWDSIRMVEIYTRALAAQQVYEKKGSPVDHIEN